LTTTPPRRRRRLQSAPAAGPDPIDIHVGARVRLRRVLLGLSQVQVSQAVGLAYQQVQKYEKGTNRISASLLHRIAQALDVPVSFFFDDMPDGQRLPVALPDDTMIRVETVELVRHYYLAPEPLRRLVFYLVKAMAQEEMNAARR